ncbi:SE-cephalotoxin-like [Clytia hemisphaerica]|uniref:EGF-like domain-containing protein n=1 Tax=Clytia hemisphaerica TaxID=252671 RepID=A0A7M5XH10_9CNID
MGTKMFLSILIILTLLPLKSHEVDVELIENTLTNTQAIVDIIEERNTALQNAGKAVGPLVSKIGALAPFLGAAGAFISILLAFLPQDSAEIQLMKTEFAEVNKKLDIITHKLDNIERLIKIETQKAAYIDSESKINFGFTQLAKFYDELMGVDCTEESKCLKERTKIAERYNKDFKAVVQPLFQILQNSYDQNQFAQPILELVKEEFQCDVGELNSFVETIYLFARQGQQVVVTHHKLSGSNTSVVTSVQQWINMVYALRNKLYVEKKHCYDFIETYMANDINDLQYQDGTNAFTFRKLDRLIRSKYAWLGWNFQIYNGFSNKEEAFKVIQGFSNAPSTKEKRKRAIIATPIDPLATYSKERINLVRNAIKKIDYYDIKNNDKSHFVKLVEEILKKAGIYKHVQSIVALKTNLKIEIEEDRFDSYLNEEFTFDAPKQPSNPNNQPPPPPKKVRVVVMVKPVEADTSFCDEDTCHGSSKCVQLPFTKLTECQCEIHFDGERCETYSENSLSSTLDLLVTTSLTIPSLTDVYFDIQDLKESFSDGIENVNNALIELGSVLEQSFIDLSLMLGNEFKWTNLKVTYSETLSDVEFFIREFATRSKANGDKRGKELAEHILQPGHIKKWLSDLNLLFMGNDNLIQDHEPLLVVFMSRYSKDACTAPYKERVDHAYAQFSILQYQAFMMWAEALYIEERDTSEVQALYDKNVQEQTKRLLEVTCSYVIQNSTNVQCTGGHYTHPELQITNQCVENYYVKGTPKSTCNSTDQSRCLPCHCDAEGSVNHECTDKAGVCSCKTINVNGQMKSYYGSKCQNFDCVWGDWSSWGSCSKCGYGGSRSRSRGYAKSKVVQGKECPGSSTSSESCFAKCCGSNFNCQNTGKCISSSSKCNYRKDCSQGEDEADNTCKEYCYRHSTYWHSRGDGSVIYLDRQRGSCSSSGYIIKSFYLERSGDKQRHVFRCCRFNNLAKVPSRKSYFTGEHKMGNVHDLRHLHVKCKENGEFLTGFKNHHQWKQAKWTDFTKSHFMKTEFYCRKFDYKVSCKYGNSKSVSAGSQTQYLYPLRADCSKINGDRSFMTEYQLKSESNRFHYRMKCCKVIAQ